MIFAVCVDHVRWVVICVGRLDSSSSSVKAQGTPEGLTFKECVYTPPHRLIAPLTIFVAKMCCQT